LKEEVEVVPSFMTEVVEDLGNGWGGLLVPFGGALLLEVLNPLLTIVVEDRFVFALMSVLLETQDLVDWIDPWLKSWLGVRIVWLQYDVPTAGGCVLAYGEKLDT
jgi:hypothetical protein